MSNFMGLFLMRVILCDYGECVAGVLLVVVAAEWATQLLVAAQH